MMKEETHIFQGMRRDNHQIRQDGKFLWDAHNIRLTNRDDNTFLSITNERGTSKPILTFEGYYVGHCVLGKYLVVFTAGNNDYYIYRVEKTDSDYKVITLFHEANKWDKGWSPYNPIDAIGIYENNLIQKVYWVDGANQPRVINITKPELKEVDIINGEDYSDLYSKNSFDFVQTLSLNEDVEVKRREGSGMFSPGTIQYAFSYFNKYGQETNIFYSTPLNYISHIDRGGSPEDKISNSFEITIENCDTSFEYLRIYSIHRTSIDAVPTVKIVEDVPIPDDGDVFFIDDGTKGSSEDPTVLLYVGGRQLIAGCITAKDGTLFLGNISLPPQKNFKEIIEANSEFGDIMLPPVNEDSKERTYYFYNNPLQKGYTAGFKSGERYRCGIQAQTEDGVWSDPVWIDDIVLNSQFVTNGARHSKAIKISNGKILREKGIRKLRACVVFPKAYERDVICQGVLCPTVFNVGDRHTDSPYATSSWFFRPATNMDKEISNVYQGARIEYRHNKPLFSGGDRGAEIQNMIKGSINSPEDIKINGSNKNFEKYKPYYFVDENILTFHSPDIEFDDSLSNLDWSGARLRIIGMAQLGAISGDIDIQTETPAANPLVNGTGGFNHKTFGYTTGTDTAVNGGLVSGLFYLSGALNNDYTVTDNSEAFLVYPWNRSGSLNNDTRRAPNEDGKEAIRTAVLSKKIISNLKFFSQNVPVWKEASKEERTYYTCNISTPQLFNNNELSLLKVSVPYLNKEAPYMGNIDSLLFSSENYPIYTGITGQSINALPSEGGNEIPSGNDPVRIKYKSSPHLVFSLGNNNKSFVEVLPIYKDLKDQNESNTTLLPDWIDTEHTADGGSVSPNAISYLDYKVFSSSAKSPDKSPSKAPPRREPISSIITDNEYLGKYAYDKVPGANYKDNHLTLGFCENVNGNTVWRFNHLDGTIILLQNNVTISKNANSYLGTKSEDWYKTSEEYYIYIGESKKFIVREHEYNPVDSDPNDPTDQPFYYHTLEEVNTDTIQKSSSIVSSSEFNIHRESLTSIDTASEAYTPPYLLLAELIRNVPEGTKFGGESEEAKENNLWVPAGKPVNVVDGKFSVPFEYGDTWYSRYDCLKTYPFTKEDENQIVEIGSFMCETRINIDGRYDRNRGLRSNLSITPQNFNILNSIYSQKDNFFNYRILDKDYYQQNIFSNQITWSKEKHAGEDIDTWTNITLASTLDMNGERGQITSLKAWNEYLLCFQERALSQILFNSRVQIPVTDGVPIEISNGYKVTGSVSLSSNIGCRNKWSITDTPSGIYFMDSNTDSLYIFNGKLANLSKDRGMDWWVKQNTGSIWSPIQFEGQTSNGLRTFYDSKYGDIYFTPGPIYNSQSEALCFSEQLGQFTSFMSYGGTQAMFNFADGFYSLRGTGDKISLYQNNVGDYNNFYGEPLPFSISFIANDNPTYTKIFDTIELRADLYVDGKLTEKVPFSYVYAENEYQKSGINRFEDNPASIRKKFRVWRINIPRSGKVANRNTPGQDTSRNTFGRARLRNPWAMITLTNDEGLNNKVVLHDLTVKYTI